MQRVFSGKVALVTGASSGIGRATARAYALAGAKVIVSDVNKEAGEAAVHDINTETNGKNAAFIKCNVGDMKEIEQLMKGTLDTFGRLDCAFNNAGISGAQAPVHEMTEEQWDQVINVNLKGVWGCMKYQIPIMLKQGGGSIVNCSSILGVVGFPYSSHYVASKHAVVGLTRAAALEYATKNIRINSLNPGFVMTNMVRQYLESNPAAKTMLEAATPMHRLGTSEEMASTVLFLTSDAASYVTGHTMLADGGWVAQ
jgi:NAD(P)-dependent dehydrogenase (short-subunit alcohol dehydrogenase family)